MNPQEEAMEHFKSLNFRCPDCGLELNKEKDSLVCWICHNRYTAEKKPVSTEKSE